MQPVEEGGAGLSPEDAVDVIFNEQDTLELAKEVVAKEGLDVDLWTGSKLEGESSLLNIEPVVHD